MKPSEMTNPKGRTLLEELDEADTMVRKLMLSTKLVSESTTMDEYIQSFFWLAADYLQDIRAKLDDVGQCATRAAG